MTTQGPGQGLVEYFFDPVCPWTWNTSRWLVEVAPAEGFDITWRSLSLTVLNRDREVPEARLAAMKASHAALRLVEALRAAGRGAQVGDFYTELGRRFHHDDAPRSLDEVRAAAQASGVGERAEALEDTSWDAKIEASVDEAQSLAGKDVGSPILAIGTPRRGFFGPIVSPPPTGADALVLWRAVRDLASLPGFTELKQGRTKGPEHGPRP
ncbi:MAG: hypothetical protein GEV08_16365 [Acidimicrobiia bacterium]|nr:hypothetical protein [Acidimicrobiia bacterium]